MTPAEKYKYYTDQANAAYRIADKLDVSVVGKAAVNVAWATHERWQRLANWEYSNL